LLTKRGAPRTAIETTVQNDRMISGKRPNLPVPNVETGESYPRDSAKRHEFFPRYLDSEMLG
jgi:hypothetical protein